MSMTKKDYDKLTYFVNKKMKQGKRRFSGSPNRVEGWNEAFLSLKSMLSREIKPYLVERTPVKHERRTTRHIGDTSEVDQFICEECGIHLEDWRCLEEDDNEVNEFEYAFKYCPNCGRKVVE